MSYVSVLYLSVFLPLTLVLYQVTKKNYRWIILLIASCIFFFSISRFLIVFLLCASLITFIAGLIIGRREKKATYILIIGVVLLLGLLVMLKYSGFIIQNINILLNYFSQSQLSPLITWGVPIGISFYTLQAISYLIDVKRGQIEPEKNVARLTLYLIFFPAIMEGPIHRYKETSKELFAGEKLHYQNITLGLQKFLWGLFKKIVIADRLNGFVISIFDVNPLQHNGAVVLVGAIAYTIQLYMDFSGVIDMSLGTAEMFNIKLPSNFKQPFFAVTASEFWKRWHITLGTWFKDYVFYPVLLSKKIKKMSKKLWNFLGKHGALVISNAIALLAVWLCNGFWHGAGWQYIFFGMYYFVLLTLGVFIEPAVKKSYSILKVNRNASYIRVIRILKVAFIVVIGELFFRAKGLRTGISMFLSIFRNFQVSTFFDGSLMEFGLQKRDFIILGVALAIVLLISILKERDVPIRTSLAKRALPIRWGLYYGLIISIIVLGAYGDGYAPAEIIYAKF